jgi:uncharacterized protein (DUF1499 family)
MHFLAAAPLVLMFAGIGLSTIEVIPPLAGFAMFAFSGLLGLVAALLIYFTRVRRGRLNFRILVVVAGAPFFIALLSAAPGLAHPPINDISTDLEDPPAFVEAKKANGDRDMAYPDEFKDVVAEEYPDLGPLMLDESPERVFTQAQEIAEAQSGWEVIADDPAAMTIEGEAQSYFFHFVDDFIIRVSEDGEGGARVDMRSKSRDGKGDLGANAKRIRAFFEKLSAEESGSADE